MNLLRRAIQWSYNKESSSEEWDYFTISSYEDGEGDYEVEMLVIPPWVNNEEKGEYLKFSYSLNGGDWIECSGELSIIIPGGGNARFKAEDPGWGVIEDPFVFASEDWFNIDGTIMSLLYGDDFQDKYILNDRYKYGILTFYYEGENGTSPITSGLVNIKSKETFLPATMLVEYCYFNMFTNCINLTFGPDLPAETLVYNCYECMFKGCSRLSYIKALFTSTPSSDYTREWVNGIMLGGVFVKNNNATWDGIGTNGTPEYWKVITENESIIDGLEFPLHLEFDYCEEDTFMIHCYRAADETSKKLFLYLLDVVKKYGSGYYTGVGELILQTLGIEIYMDGVKITGVSYEDAAIYINYTMLGNNGEMSYEQ